MTPFAIRDLMRENRTLPLVVVFVEETDPARFNWAGEWAKVQGAQAPSNSVIVSTLCSNLKTLLPRGKPSPSFKVRNTRQSFEKH